MTPLIICGCALLAVVFWIIHAFCVSISSLIEGAMETIAYIGVIIGIVLLSFGGLYVVLYLITGFTSVIDMLLELLTNLIMIIISLVILGGIIYILLSFGAVILEFALGIALWIIDIIINIFDFITEISYTAFCFFVNVIQSKLDDV